MAAIANIPQSNFLAMPNKFRAFVAGFGSGKTWVGCMAMTIHALEHPGVNMGYFAPTYSHIRDIYFPTIAEVAATFELTVVIRKGDKEVDIMRGRKRLATVICRSLDRPENIIGFKIGHALVDEFDVMQLDKAAASWVKIIARLRWPGVKNGVDVTTTPEGFRFVYQTWVEDIVKNPSKAANYGLIQASTYDNELNLNPDYISSLLEAYPPELISAYLNGQFVNLTTGTVYYSYNREMHRSLTFVEEKEPLRIGMDFNVGKMAAVVYVVRGKEWHAVDEFVNVYDTPAMADAIKQRYPTHAINIYPDASGGSRKTVDASTSDLSVLRQAGFAISAHKSNPLIKDRVLATNVAFTKGLLYINDYKCPEFSKCMEQLPYDKNGSPDKTTGLDHMADAGTYPIAYSMPVVKPVHKIKIGFV